MLLYDVDSTLLQFQSAWQATDSFSLLPGQCGPMNCPYIFCSPDILHFNSDPSPSSVDGTPLVTLDCLSTLRCIQEGVLGGYLPRSGMGGDPGEHQVWPFDPGLSQYSPTHMESPPFSPIWGATDSLLLSPAQSGLMEFPCYPHLLDIHSLHLSQEATGDHFIWGKIGGRPGEWQYAPFDPGSLHYRIGQVLPIWGPMTVFNSRPLRMGGCSPTVAPRGVYICHLTPGHGTTGTWFKRWLPLSTFPSTNLT